MRRSCSPPVVLLLCSVLWLLWAVATVCAADTAPERFLELGRGAFQRGDLAQAVVHWREAVRQAEQAQQRQAQSVALTHLAHAYQALGHYELARENLAVALRLAEQVADQQQMATVLGSLGDVYGVLGPAERAVEYLQAALARARAQPHAPLEASLLNSLGNVQTAQNAPLAALEAYRASATLARGAGLLPLLARALANASMAAIYSGHSIMGQALLEEASLHVQRLAPSHDAAYVWTKIGLTSSALQPHVPADLRAALEQQAAAAFKTAAAMAQGLGDQRAASYAWGYLGRLYEAARRSEEALHLTRQAILAAQRVAIPEALYQWQWQLGRLCTTQGDQEAALAAYRQAIATLRTLRHELPSSYGQPPTAFRTAVGPVYFELVDLLLQRAAVVSEPGQAEPYLREARQTVEAFKAAELQEYFRDDCVEAAQATSAPLEMLSSTAAIVYPIVLPTRLELLVSLPTGLQRVAVPVTEELLVQVARSLRQALQTGATRRALSHASRLYDWLLRPLEAMLATAPVQTLVFVPDGVLRTIPMAVLHDGSRFLIQKYAVATTPGLTLTDPRPLPRGQAQMLAVGVARAVQGFPALPYVAQELRAVHALYGGSLLLNEDFQRSRLEQTLQRGDFSMMHIASHGQFANDVSQSFVLTFDHRLTMPQLEQLIGGLRGRTTPLELLTLSACETALGDDRAALGLAGIAIKAGARSALATLWRVQDEAAALLVTEFYRHLQDPTVSRAVALQRAQLALLNHPRYQDPFFWSPFLLLNNWL